MRAQNVGVICLAGDFGKVVGFESAIFGGRPWRKSLRGEFRGFVVADQDAGFVLGGVLLVNDLKRYSWRA